MSTKLSRFSEIELLKLHSSIIEELKARNVVRTRNNPIGDYTEWLVKKALKLELSNNSKMGYDGKDKRTIKYQIKGRQITPENKSKQLSVIRKLEDKKFDFLIAVLFDKDFKVSFAAKIPHEVVKKYASYKDYVKGHIVHIQGAILRDSRVQNITRLIRNVNPSWNMHSRFDNLQRAF